MTDLFQAASRQKLRFETPRGLLSIEDLWDLPLTSARSVSLDTIALDLHAELKAATDVVSFVDQTAKPDEILQLKFDLVKYVIDVRKAEALETRQAAERREAKQRLLAALDRKREQKIETMSEEEIN